VDSPRVLVGFGRWPKGGRMLSIVVKIMPFGEKEAEVAAIFERTEHFRTLRCRESNYQAIRITDVTRFPPY
jgi:hypothetical protein